MINYNENDNYYKRLDPNKWGDPHKKGGFEDIELPKICRDPSHEPPMHICIPYGQRFIHICPTCGQKTILNGSNITW